MITEPTSQDAVERTREALAGLAIEAKVKEQRKNVPYFHTEGRTIYDPALVTIQQIYDRIAADMSTATDTKTLIQLAQEAIKDAMFWRGKFDLSVTELIRLGIHATEHYGGGHKDYRRQF